MKSVNNVVLLGHVGRDPDIRTTTSGSTMANVSLATTFKRKDGKESTEWHRLTAFGPVAEVIEKYVRKGDPLYVEGWIHYDSYEKNGQKFYTTDINVRNVILLGSRPMRASEPEPEEEEAPGELPF